MQKGKTNLVHAIQAENLKTRHSKIRMVTFILPLLTALVGMIIYRINDAANLFGGAQWQQLWLQTGLFYGYFFFPMLIAILASYLWRLEHIDYNWNRLMTTTTSRLTVFVAKLVILAKEIWISQSLLMVFLLLIGKFVFHFNQPIPLNFLWWLGMGWFSALGVGAIQLYLSMRIRSFAVPVGLSLCLCLVGLGFYILGLELIFPYSQLIVGLASQDLKLPLESFVPLVVAVSFYVLLICTCAVRYLKKHDIISS